MGKGRSNQRAIVFKYTAKLDKGFLRVRHNVQCIGDNDNIKGLVSIRQMKHILHGKIQLGGKITPLCLRNHRCGGVGSLNVVGRTQEMFCHLPLCRWLPPKRLCATQQGEAMHIIDHRLLRSCA